MTKKAYAQDVLSSQVCQHPDCQKKIKLRLAESERDFPLCYKHWKKADYWRRAIGTKR